MIFVHCVVDCAFSCLFPDTADSMEGVRSLVRLSISDSVLDDDFFGHAVDTPPNSGEHSRHSLARLR
jgi:hypothetical protein